VKKRPALRGVFVFGAASSPPARLLVANLETIGPRRANDEIREFAAVRVIAAGAIKAEFLIVVRAGRPVPSAIIKLTDIAQLDSDRQGRPSAESIKAFVAFIDARPVFSTTALRHAVHEGRSHDGTVVREPGA
jgi:hypothetical protein